MKPNSGVKEVLVLFGGYPERIADMKREFRISDIAKQNGVSVLFMNYNQKLWLEEGEKEDLAKRIQRIFDENKLPVSKVYFGGYSSGGNVALLLSDYLVQENAKLGPQGVFVIDSPIDLVALYRSSVKNIKRKFSEPSVRESTWIIETLGEKFGHPDTAISNYERYSILTLETKNFQNISNLKDVKVRLYSEPEKHTALLIILILLKKSLTNYTIFAMFVNSILIDENKYLNISGLTLFFLKKIPLNPFPTDVYSA